MVTLNYLYLQSKLQDIICHIHHHDSHQSKIILPTVLCSSQEKSADCNLPAVSALLLLLEFKFLPIFKKNTDDASIWNTLFHYLHNTHDKLSPQLSNRYTIDYTRYIGKDESSNMLNYYVYIVNFFFGLISILTENTDISSYEEKSRRDIINAYTSFNEKCPSFSTDFQNPNILTNFSSKPTHEILR
jgi:hypothetical protein